MSSSLNKHVANSKDILDTQEQSGWTYYLEDFSLDQREHSSNSDESFCSPSLVSDAASYAAWKMISDKKQKDDGFSSLHPLEFPKRLNFDKPRRKRIFYEDDLEDTASSPVNSPKVSSVKQIDMDLRRQDESIGNLQDKHAGSYPFSGLRTVEKRSINYDAKAGYDCTELGKRGLCLVPLSMVVNNYLH